MLSDRRITKRVLPLLLAVFTVSVLSSGFFGCSLMRKRYEKSEQKEFAFKLGEKKSLTLDNVNGRVSIRRSINDSLIKIKADLQTSVTKKELDEPIKNIRIEIDSSDTEIRVKTNMDYEKKMFRFNIGKSTKVDYDIEVPAGISVSVNNTNGKIYLEDLTNNDITVDVTNGGIKAEKVFGMLKFDVTNGSISAELDSVRGIDFETVNGSIKIKAGDKFSGMIDAGVVNGKISTKNLNIRIDSEGRKYLKGKIGESDAVIKLNTVNGKINIEKR